MDVWEDGSYGKGIVVIESLTIGLMVGIILSRLSVIVESILGLLQRLL